MEVLCFEVWRRGRKAKDTKYVGLLTAEKALDALQAENPLWTGKLTVKDNEVGLVKPHKMDSSKIHVLQLTDPAGRKSFCARTPIFMLPKWMPSWMQYLFTLVMPTIPASSKSEAQALLQHLEQRLDHPILSPQAHQLVEDSSFVILVDTIPGSKRKCDKEKVPSGMGFFYGSHTALSCAHNLPDDLLSEGKVVQAVEKDTKRPTGMSKMSLTIRDFDSELDWVRLTAKEKHTFVPLFQGPVEDLLAAPLGMCSFYIRLHQELSATLPSIGVLPGVGLHVSHNARHLLYSCPACGGDSGAAVVLYKGQIAAMHQEGVIAASELLSQRKDTETDEETKDRLNEIADSLSSIIQSTSQGLLALTAKYFPKI